MATKTSWHDAPAEEKKREAEQAIAQVLDAMAEENREPDEWEARDLLAAMGAILGRMYALSLNLTFRAMTEPAQRAGVWDRSETTPLLRDLRRTLEYIEGAPAR